MPIHTPQQSSPPMLFPKSDYAIVKYLDLTRFISILQRQSLFFCRLDKLEDKFEGTTAKPNYESRIHWRQQLRSEGYFTTTITDEDIEKAIKNQYEFEERLKSVTCVNCWNKNEEESAALWKIYSDFSKGVMIKSSISQIQNALLEAPHELFLSEVRYINYEKQVMPDGNSMYPIIHKQTAYHYEEEVRIIYEIPNVPGWKHDWSKEEVEEGIYIPVNVGKLFQEVIISPYSPEWFFALVQDIASKYSLDVTVKKSKLTPPKPRG